MSKKWTKTTLDLHQVMRRSLFCITIPNRLLRLWHVEKKTSFIGATNSAMHAKVVKFNEDPNSRLEKRLRGKASVIISE